MATATAAATGRSQLTFYNFFRRRKMEQTLTIGMAHHNDYDGAYFTIQDIKKELIFNQRWDLLEKIEFLIVENDPESSHAQALRNLEKQTQNLRIVDFSETEGTSATRNKIVEEAKGNFVLVLDCHVLLCPVVKTLDKLFTFIEHNKNSSDLFSGPLIHENGVGRSSHYNDVWGGQMWGQWGNAWQCVCEAFNFSVKNDKPLATFVDLETQEKLTECVYCGREFPQDMKFGQVGAYLNSEGFSRVGTKDCEAPFPIFAQGLGCFLTRKNSWLKFNEHARGFGGEECYIHEKYRANGQKCIYLPFLQWLHRFNRPQGVPYTLTAENKVRNYILEFLELGKDISPIKKHFVEDSGFPSESFEAIHDECLAIYGEQDNQDGKDLQKEIDELNLKLKKLKHKKSKCSGKCKVNQSK